LETNRSLAARTFVESNEVVAQLYIVRLDYIAVSQTIASVQIVFSS